MPRDKGKIEDGKTCIYASGEVILNEVLLSARINPQPSLNQEVRHGLLFFGTK